MNIDMETFRKRVGNSPLRLIFFFTALALKAKTVVELGTGTGESAGAFLSALELTGGTLYSVDLYPERKDQAETLRKFKDNSRFVFIHSDSVEAGKKWDKGEIDVLYCDVHESRGHSLNELRVWGRFKPKVVFVHDIFSDVHGTDEPPYYACEDYARETGKKFIPILTVPQGLGVFIEGLKKEEKNETR